MRARPASAEAQAVRTGRSDVWPHTSRPLPWLLAGFLTLLFLAPIGGVKLDLPAPVDPYLDRYALVAVIAVWIVVLWTRRRSELVTERPGLFLGATILFVSIALLSVVLNAGEIARHDLLGLSQNRLALLIAYVLFGWFAIAAMRPSELANFSVLFVALAAITAVGVIAERRTGYNVFYEGFGSLFKGIGTVAETPTEIRPELFQSNRKVVVGPTEHGLAATTMLVMAFPFAIVAFVNSRGSSRWLYALAMALILGAALSTERKTAVFTPVAAMLVIAAYRPRVAVRMLPVGVVCAGLIHVMAPGALGTVYQLENLFGSDSSEGRASDYSAIAPDVFSHPLLGWGYGTRDIEDVDHVRILDNEYLNQLMTVGVIGLLAFIAMIVSAMVVAHRAIESGDPARAGPALAASASCAVFLLVCALFDSMGFPQAPYGFFFVAAIATVAASREVPARAAERVRAPLGRPVQVGAS